MVEAALDQKLMEEIMIIQYDFDYCAREADYHVRAAKNLLLLMNKKNGVRREFSSWLRYVKLIKDHHVMAKFYIERMKTFL